MTTFTVWGFDNPDGATQAETALKAAQSDGLVKIIDQVVVTWPVGASKPETTATHEDKRRGTGWGAFLGAFVGMLFFAPILGAAVGAGIGSAVKAHEGTSISKEDVERIRAQITPGTSALFVVTDQGNLERLGERFHGLGQKLITTNLTDAERAEMLESFGG